MQKNCRVTVTLPGIGVPTIVYLSNVMLRELKEYCIKLESGWFPKRNHNGDVASKLQELVKENADHFSAGSLEDIRRFSDERHGQSTSTSRIRHSYGY